MPIGRVLLQLSLSVLLSAVAICAPADAKHSESGETKSNAGMVWDETYNTSKEGNPHQGEAEPFTIHIRRANVAPKIDGRLSEPVWFDAPVISNFKQVRPKEGGEPTERTEVRLLYDSNHLFLGIRAFDSEPERIIAREMQRDAPLNSEDRVRFTVDTFHNLRSGYYFAVNARGARRDGLITPGGGNRGYDAQWDGIWYGKSKIDAEGWVVEIAIPTKTINFDPAIDAWGFNIERDIERKNERVRWSTPVRNKHITSMADAGTIINLENLTQGKGLDFVPYGKIGFVRDDVFDREDFDVKAGFDVFYNITPAITAALTVKTDFAESEVDARRVNLTRFPLFFEEKRGFFLQDANLFRFAKIRRSPLPFHSRRIGLSPEREPLDILAGVKVTGRAGRLNFGLLSIQVDESENLKSKNLSVARVSLNMFGESEAGIIVTNGDPRTDGENTLIGIDFNFKDSNFRDTEQIFESHLYLMRSFSTGRTGDDRAFGASLLYPNDRLDAGIRFEQIGADFNPALGFVERRGTREYEGWIGRGWFPSWADEIELSVSGRVRTQIDGEIIDGEIVLPQFKIESNRQDDLEFSSTIRREQLFETFEIFDGVNIPAGVYDFTRFQVEMRTSQSRAINLSLMAEFGDYFGGERTTLSSQFGWRPSPHFNIAAAHEVDFVKLPQGDFTVHIVQIDINIMFSPELVWNITQHYDNASDEYGINSRIRWTIKPGRDLFVVFNQGVDTSEGRWRTLRSELTSKVGWTFRF